MSWSRCSGRVAAHLLARPGHAVLSQTPPRHRPSALSHSLPPSAPSSPQPHSADHQSSGGPRPSWLQISRQHSHVSGLGSRQTSLVPPSLATASSVRDLRVHAHSGSQGRAHSTQAKDGAVPGPTYIDAFAGIGGFGLALAKRGYNCVYANDNDPHCARTYERNHCRGGPGISEVDSRDIESVTRSLRHPERELPRATILCGGFPCPPFSHQGNTEGLDDEKRGHLFYEMVKLAIYLQIPWLILENVSTFATNKRFEGIQEARKEFEAAGYYMSSGVYNAVDFNLAQNRPRCFIVAVRQDLASSPFQFKSPPSRRQDLALTDFLDPPAALKDPSSYTLHNGVLVPKRTVRARGGETKEIIWSDETLEERTRSNGLKLLGRWAHRGQTPYQSGNRIYHHSGFASCILTGSGDWYQVPGPDGMEIIRQLSLRETLRLQGLPDSLKLSPTLTQARKEVGNSVPPPMVDWIVRCLEDQYPDVRISATHSTTEVWPRVQARGRSLEEKKCIRQRLKNLSRRKLLGKARREARREAQKALEEEDGDPKTSDSESVKAGHGSGSGKSLAARKKRFNDLGQQMEALEKAMASLKTEYKLLVEAQPGRTRLVLGAT